MMRKPVVCVSLDMVTDPWSYMSRISYRSINWSYKMLQNDIIGVQLKTLSCEKR